LKIAGEGVEDLVAVLVHTNGLGSSFQAWIQAARSASSSVTLRSVERRRLRSVSSANQRSTRFSQLAEVGVKCRWNGVAQQPGLDHRGLVGGVVVADQVQLQLW
jgi:hypothetical protein